MKNKIKFIGILLIFIGIILIIFGALRIHFDQTNIDYISETSAENESNFTIKIMNNYTKDIFTQNKIREGVLVGELVKEEQENNPDISTAVAQERISETDSTNIWWLSCVLFQECRGLNDEAQIAVASVIMNRVKSDKFPNTIFEVIVQPGQYAFVNDEIIWGEPDERTIKNAEYVYWNGSQIPENVLFQAEFIQESGVWKQMTINIFVTNRDFCID